VRRWLQAVSESSDDELVFRPEGHPLPPARGRVVLDVDDDGSFSALAPGPVDAPVPTTDFDDWEIATQEPDRLTLRRGPRPPASP
jgi:hypothetical protein